MRDLAIEIRVEKERAVQALADVDRGVEKIASTAATTDTQLKKQQETTRKYFGQTEADLKKFVTGMETAGRKMQSAGMALTAGITLPLAGLATASVATGKEFERVMNSITGVLRPTATEMDRVRAKAIEMGAATAFSATDAATAMLELGKAGMSTGDTIGAVDRVLELAAASGLSMGDSAEMAARSLAGFGLKATDLSHVNDVLAKAVNASTLEITDLQTAFRYIGPLAQGVGMSIEQTSAAIAIMRDRGVAAETAGRALREGLGRLLNPTKNVAGGLLSLGVTVEDATGKLLPFDQIIERLQPHAQNTGAILKIFGDAAGPGMAALLSAGSGALRQLTTDLEQSDGAAKAMADSMMAGLPGAFERMKGSVETALLSISKALEPVLIPILDLIGKVADVITTVVVPAFSALPQPVQSAVIVLAGLVAAAGPLLAMFGSLAMAVGSVIAVWPTLVVGAGAVGTALTTVGGVIAAIVTGPIGLLVAAIGAVVAAWYYWDEIVVIVQNVYTAVKTWLVDNFGTVLKPLFALIQSVGEMFMAFGELVSAVVVKVVGYVADLVKGVTLWLVDKLKPIWQPIGVAIQAVATVFEKVAKACIEFARQLYEGVKKWLVDNFVGIVNSVKAKIDAVTGFFKDLHDKVVGHSYVPDLVRGVETWFNKLEGVMVSPTRTAVGSVTGLFQDMATSVTNVVGDMLAKLAGMLTGFLDKYMPSWAANLLGGMATNIVGGLLSGGLSGGVKGILGTALGIGGGEGGLLGGLLGGGSQGGLVSSLFGGGGGSGYIAADVGKASGIGGGAGALGNLARFGGGGLAAAAGLYQLLTAKTKVGSTLGGLEAGAGIGTMIAPGIGTVIGAGVGALAGFIKGAIGGPSQEEKDARTLAGQFHEAVRAMLTDTQRLEAGGVAWKEVNIGVRDTFIAIGKSEQDAMNALAGLNAATHKSPAEVRAALAPILAAYDAYEQQVRGTTEAITSLADAHRYIVERGPTYLLGDPMDLGAMGSGSLQGFASGTHGQYPDFGSGTPVMLHGRERIMTEREGHASGGIAINGVNVYMQHGESEFQTEIRLGRQMVSAMKNKGVRFRK